MSTSQTSRSRSQSDRKPIQRDLATSPQPTEGGKTETSPVPLMKSLPSLPSPLIQASKTETSSQAGSLTSSPRTPKKSSLGFGLPIFRSPRQRQDEKGKSAVDELSSGSGSSSAPGTPRGNSKTSDNPPIPSVRRRVDSSPQKLSTPPYRSGATTVDILPPARDADNGLIELGNEIAGLIFSTMRSNKPVLTKETIDSLARYEVQIPVDTMSPELKMKVEVGKYKTQSHAQLIKALFLPRLMDTQVGKTLVAMRSIVMMQYDGDALTIADRTKIEETDLGFKKRMQANIEQQARACADIILGIVGSMTLPSLANSKLPASLIAFWTAMDRELCEWAADNPKIDANLLRKARENLGFDLLLTRLILPIALGKESEAHLVIPMMFFDAVKNALKAEWPAFFDSFIAASEMRSGNPASSGPASSANSHSDSPRKKATLTSFTTTTNATTNTTTTTTTTNTTTTTSSPHHDPVMN